MLNSGEHSRHFYLSILMMKKIHKIFSTVLLTLLLIGGVVSKASALPFWGTDNSGNFYCKNGTMQWTSYYYVFWIEVSHTEHNTGTPCPE